MAVCCTTSISNITHTQVLRDEYSGDVHISTGMTTKSEIEHIVAFWEEGNGVLFHAPPLPHRVSVTSSPSYCHMPLPIFRRCEEPRGALQLHLWLPSAIRGVSC